MEGSSIFNKITSNFKKDIVFKKNTHSKNTPSYDRNIKTKNEILESNNVIVIDSKDYRKLYKNTELYTTSYNDIHYECYIIKKLIQSEETTKTHIITDKKDSAINFYNSQEVYQKSEISELCKTITKEKSSKLNKYNYQFFEFSNRLKEKKTLKDILCKDDYSKKETIVKVLGAAQIGKSSFVNKVVNEIKTNSLNSTSPSLAIKTIYISYNIEKDQSLKYIKEKILNTSRMRKTIPSTLEISEHIAAEESNIILILDNIELIRKPHKKIESIVDMYVDIANSIKKINCKSIMSLILISRKDIRLNSAKYKKSNIHEIILPPLNKSDVKDAIESYMHINGANKSKDFFAIVETIWQLTRGLPGALSYVLPKIVGGYIDRYYKIGNITNEEFNTEMCELHNNYIKNNLLSKKCFYNNDIKYNFDISYKEILKYVLPYRFLWKNTIQRILKQIPESKLTSQTLEYFLSESCLVHHGSSSFLRYSLVELDPSIREILFIHCYNSSEERAKIHQETKVWYMGKSKQLAFSDTYFWEILWHHIELNRLLKTSQALIEEEIKEIIKTFTLDIVDRESRGVIINKIKLMYKKKPEHIKEIELSLMDLNINKEVLDNEIRRMS